MSLLIQNNIILSIVVIRAFANSFADYDLTQKTDNYILIHMDEIIKGPQTMNLPYLQVDVFGGLPYVYNFTVLIIGINVTLPTILYIAYQNDVSCV